MIKTDFFSHTGHCEYIKGIDYNITYCYATDVTDIELSRLLAKGWRKFGDFYFKNNCQDCFQCIPLRINVKEFTPSKSQRRLLNKNHHIEIKLEPLNFKEEIYDIFCDHSKNRLNRTVESVDDFLSSFYIESCPAMQSEYYLDNKLVAVGFLDIAGNALSSVYFIYRTEYSQYSLGNYSILKEIEIARSLNKNYYYLGYYVEGNKFMKYKNAFYPNEKMAWKTGKWSSYPKPAKS